MWCHSVSISGLLEDHDKPSTIYLLTDPILLENIVSLFFFMGFLVIQYFYQEFLTACFTTVKRFHQWITSNWFFSSCTRVFSHHSRELCHNPILTAQIVYNHHSSQFNQNKVVSTFSLVRNGLQIVFSK